MIMIHPSRPQYPVAQSHPHLLIPVGNYVGPRTGSLYILRYTSSRHRTFTSSRAMEPDVDGAASAVASDDLSRINTTQSESDVPPAVEASRVRGPLPTTGSTAQAHGSLFPSYWGLVSQSHSVDGHSTPGNQAGTQSDDMEVEVNFDAESASDTSRLRTTETIRPARSVVSSVPPAMHVDRNKGIVTRSGSGRKASGSNSRTMDAPPQVEDVNIDDVDWEDPLHDNDLWQAQAEAEARGIGERADAYAWPVESHVIDWSAYLHNTDRILEKFPSYPSIPIWVYAKSSRWAADRAKALNAPRQIENCHRDRFHMHGQAVHAWQAKGAVFRRNLMAKVYLPALLDHLEFGDRVIGALVQATFVAKIDDGPGNLPEVQVHFSRLIQNNSGMKKIGDQMAIAFKRGIADIAHENFTNYKQLEWTNQQRKLQRKTPLENLTEPPSIPMRELVNHANMQEVRDSSVVPPDIAARVGVKAYSRLNDQNLYVVSPQPAESEVAPQLQPQDHVHERVEVILPSPSAPVIRNFQDTPPDVSPHDIGHILQDEIITYLDGWDIQSTKARQEFAMRAAALYWCCSPLSWRAQLETMLTPNATAAGVVDKICFAMECQHLSDWMNGLR
ncbi:hypothetical protein CALCODRAFT_510078 [Calocera cornea HHB12733]|uniref:Uncharacterized protein n=1 Tax=Calocera cornea HHB12733 TaxID=1353952 RepID=A0A165ESV3_9BASI|nr:hypothetical protein CALCODRAFT_510078 [Calocera cornea HHB12733]